jgi:hypothetical protein
MRIGGEELLKKYHYNRHHIAKLLIQGQLGPYDQEYVTDVITSLDIQAAEASLRLELLVQQLNKSGTPVTNPDGSVPSG